MTKFRFVLAVVLLAECASDSDLTCTETASGRKCESLGASMLQTSGLSMRTAPTRKHSRLSKLMPTKLTDRSKVAQQPPNSKLFLGSLMPLEEKGFQVVAGTCCHLEMELYIRRLVEDLDLELCDESVLLSLLPLYSTCEPGERDFETLKTHVLATQYDPKCIMAAPVGSCPSEQVECVADPAGNASPTAHRRRQCNSHSQRPAVGEQVNCPLPAGGIWCEVRLKKLPPFFMAVYDWSVAEDWVSYNICGAGFWEESDMSEFGLPGHMLDIGGNVGYHAFAFAQANWTVTTFEPMASNLALMNATLCRNPALATKIKVMPYGLGSRSQECKLMAPKDNVGDGFAKCGGVLGEHPTPGYKEVGNFSTRRLDEVLVEQNMTQVDVVKVDVEGYEAQVFAGAPNFLTQYHPRLVKSEVWERLANSTGYSYLTMFQDAGYGFFSDLKCQVPVNAKTEVLRGGLDVIMCK